MNHNVKRFEVKHAMNPYQLVLFDFDGTLCDTGESDTFTIQKTYEVLKHPVPSNQNLEKVMKAGPTPLDFFKQLSPEASFDFIQTLVKTYRTLYAQEATSANLFPDVITVLERLKANGVAMAIVSNKDHELLKLAVTSLKVGQYFSLIVGSKEGAPHKPDANLYHETIVPHFLHISTQATLMVGDTDTDLRFAANSSIDACWARYGVGDERKCESLHPTYTIEAVSDLLNRLKLA